MWEIYAYNNTDSLFGIFNAVAALLGTDSYRGAMAGVLFCGFAVALGAYCFTPEKLQGWKWIASVLLVNAVLLVPKVTVGIVDKTGGGPTKVVANVPLGIALFGSVTSSIGNTLTEVSETAFQAAPGNAALASAFAYQKGGLVFGNRMVQATRTVSMTDPRLRVDAINFVLNCTMYDLADGTLDPQAFATSDDVWSLMGSPNPARFTPVAAGAGTTLVTCPAAYLSLGARLPAQIVSIESLLAAKMNPTLPAAFAASVIAGQIEQAYIRNSIADASSDAAALIRQNALINAISDAGRIQGQKSNDSASLLTGFARAQATAQQNAIWVNGAKMAEEALPLIRNVIEAVCYAIFPIVVLLLFLTHGRETFMAVKAYCAVLIWIQLWPPLYAFLNYAATIYSQYDLAAAANVGGGLRALSLQTSSAIYANAISAEAVVGSLVILIPGIAWAALKRMETLGTALVDNVRSLQQTVSADTGAAASGNVALGSVSMDQHTISPTSSNPWVSRTQSASGDWLTRDGTGRRAVSLLRNEGYASRTVSYRASEGMVADASHSVESTRSEAVGAVNDRTSALSDTLSTFAGRDRGFRSLKGTATATVSELGESADKLSQIVDQVAQSTGVGKDEVQRIAFDAALQAKVFGNGFGASTGKNYSGTLSEEQKKVASALTSDQVGEFQRFADRVTHETAMVATLSSNHRDGKEVAARLADTTSRSERAERAYRESVGLLERLSVAREAGEVITADVSSAPENAALQLKYAAWAAQHGTDSSALQILMASELARQSPRPAAVFSDGAAVPRSFHGVRDLYQRSLDEPAMQPNLERRGDLIGPRPENRVGTSDTEAEATRRTVSAAGDATRSEAHGRIANFDRSAGIRRLPDGRPATDAFVGNARQLADDLAELKRESDRKLEEAKSARRAD